MSFIKPGLYPVFSLAHSHSFKAWKEPPENMSADPSFGHEGLENDPMPRQMLVNIGINELVNSVNIELLPDYGRVSFSVDRYCLEQMNFDQRWVLSCCLLNAMEIFVGEKMDQQLTHRITHHIACLISYLAQNEIRPGEWDEDNHNQFQR